MLRICKLSPAAIVPSRATPGSAGYDLYSTITVDIPAHGKALIPIDIAIELPAGTYGRIAPRSGLAHQSFIGVGAGVIDRDYRGNIHVLLFNLGGETFHVHKGHRIAQLILECHLIVDVKEVPLLHASDTIRGVGGFMSTGT
jgi:dUTP pyrophosphatase